MQDGDALGDGPAGRAGAEPGQAAEVAGAELEIECGGRGRGQSREARGRGGQTRTGGHGVAGADDDPLFASGQGADMIEEVRDARSEERRVGKEGRWRRAQSP